MFHLTLVCFLMAFFYQSAEPSQNKSNSIYWGENEQTSVTTEQKEMEERRGDKRESETGGRTRYMKVWSEIAEEMGAGMSFPAVIIL